jgi:hypothetical protein
MGASRRPPPPAAAASGLFECLCALAEEAQALGLLDSARTILMAADFVAIEAEENNLPPRSTPPRPGDSLSG